MMIQIGHRESHDIDIFLDDPQLLGFIDPYKSRLRFDLVPSGYQGDGLRFQKFAFEGIGENFIVAGAADTSGLLPHGNGAEPVRIGNSETEARARPELMRLPRIHLRAACNDRIA